MSSGSKGLLVFPELTSTNGKAVLKFEERITCCRKSRSEKDVGFNEEDKEKRTKDDKSVAGDFWKLFELVSLFLFG